MTQLAEKHELQSLIEDFDVGDCDCPFTMQSVSKPFTFGMALEDIGVLMLTARPRRTSGSE